VSTLLTRAEPAALHRAIWSADAELLTLWHGERVPVRPGDRVRFYEPADGMLIFVDIDEFGTAGGGRHGDA